ncbi:MAG TPA: enoyl-CoA hydratase-related protein [Anaerovoracaceae bacterium]|nr:enoyl-CoA hydratase-related protein [Anaerovoracaceae bacterium]
MKFKNILYENNDGIALVTMNRPEALNAFNKETLGELSEIIDFAEQDASVKVLIFTGQGKSFIAGADIAEMSKLEVLEGRDVALKGQAVFFKVENIGKPTIAAINGFALGGGCEFAMSCDIRIASEFAKFGQPEVSLGIIPGWGGTQRLPRLIGKGLAKYYIYTGEIFNAEEAYRIGLVEKIVKADELMTTAQTIAKTIMSKAPVAVKMAKGSINNGLSMDLKSGVAYEAEAYATSFGCADRMEGTAAFMEKRKANFAGK